MKRTEVEAKAGGVLGGFMSGVLVLSLSTFAVKIIGLAYKIPMLDLLGAEGMGYFNSAYEIYALLCIIATAGLPIALSMLVSVGVERGDFLSVRRVYKGAMLLFAAIGTVGGAVMFAFADKMAAFIENPQAAPCIRAIAPALLCVCISSAVRGYFQGLGNMTPTAISQLIEAVGKLTLGVLFAALAARAGYGTADAAAFGILGLSAGTLISALYLLMLKLLRDRRDVRSPLESRGAASSSDKEGGVGKLIRLAIPITLSSTVLGVTRIADMALIMRRLQDIGYSAAGANVIYGSYTTLAVPIFNLLPSLITPLALAVVPRLSAALLRERGEGAKEIVGVALRISVLFSMPASVAIAVYSKQMLGLLFAGEGEAIEIAAPLLAALGASVLFSCLITTTNAILQAYGRANVAMISMSIGAALKIGSAYLLIGTEGVGAYGAPLSTLVCNVAITAINFYFINKCAERTLGIRELYIKPLFCSAVMIAVSFAGYLALERFFGSERIGFIFAALIGVISYIFFSLLLGAVEREDIEALPAGARILSVLRKLRIGNFEKT